MAVYSTSLLEDTHSAPTSSFAEPTQSREQEFKDVLDAALDPALQMCAKMAEMRTSKWDQAVFGVNCTETVLTALEGFGFTAERVAALEEEESGHVESLTAEHVRRSCFGVSESY